MLAATGLGGGGVDRRRSGGVLGGVRAGGKRRGLLAGQFPPGANFPRRRRGVPGEAAARAAVGDPAARRFPTGHVRYVPLALHDRLRPGSVLAYDFKVEGVKDDFGSSGPRGPGVQARAARLPVARSSRRQEARAAGALRRHDGVHHTGFRSMKIYCRSAQYRAQRTLYCSTRRHTPCGGWSTTCATTLRSPQLAKRRAIVVSHLAERDRAARPEAGAATHARRCSGGGRARRRSVRRALFHRPREKRARGSA